MPFQSTGTVAQLVEHWLCDRKFVAWIPGPVILKTLKKKILAALLLST